MFRGLALSNSNQGPIPNRIIRVGSEPSEHLCTFFPGSDYSIDGPYFYFLINMFLERGVDCLLIDRVWAREAEWLNANRLRREALARDEAAMVLDQVLSLGYPTHSIVAKSLGTRAMAPFIKSHASKLSRRNCIAQIIWLTPSLGEQWSVLRTPFRHYVVIGSEDKLMSQFQPYTDIDHSVIKNADHGLNRGNAIESAAALCSFLPDVSRWLLTDTNADTSAKAKEKTKTKTKSESSTDPRDNGAVPNKLRQTFA